MAPASPFQALAPPNPLDAFMRRVSDAISTTAAQVNPFGLVFDPEGAPVDQYVSPEELARRQQEGFYG